MRLTVRLDETPAADRQVGAVLQRVGRAAVLALYDELALSPKPGLVSFVDSGSHHDMDARTFMRSLFSLRHTFPRLAVLGAECASFEALEREGIAAEARMLAATGGVNTHRGAIFSLGLLCASAGALAVQRVPIVPCALRNMLMSNWGGGLAARSLQSKLGQGAIAAQLFGLRSAGAEASLGFPVLFQTTLPALLSAQARGATTSESRLQALFETMAVLDDTNLLHRGGLHGLRHVQCTAHAFVAAGGVGQPDAMTQACAVHADFVARRLSPGGAADMLAAACWLQRVCEVA